MGRQRTTTLLSRSSRSPAAASSRTFIHVSWIGPGFNKRSAATPRPECFPSTGLTGWKWRLTIPPFLECSMRTGLSSLDMAASIYRQWICHTPDVMKTDIFAARNAIESGKSTRGSIRFDSVAAGHGCRWAYSLIANHILRILKISQLFSDSWPKWRRNSGSTLRARPFAR